MTNPNEAVRMLREALDKLDIVANRPASEGSLRYRMAEYLANIQDATEPPEQTAQGDAELPPLPEWTKRDDLVGITPSEIRAAMREYGRACRLQSPASDAQIKPEGWMWQHDETGRMGFVDVWQVEQGWQSANPRLKLVKPLYAEPTSVDAARWQAIESACVDREILEMVEAVAALMAYKCQVPLSQIKGGSPAQNLDAAIAAQSSLKDSTS